MNPRRQVLRGAAFFFFFFPSEVRTEQQLIPLPIALGGIALVVAWIFKWEIGGGWAFLIGAATGLAVLIFDARRHSLLSEDNEVLELDAMFEAVASTSATLAAETSASPSASEDEALFMKERYVAAFEAMKDNPWLKRSRLRRTLRLFALEQALANQVAPLAEDGSKRGSLDAGGQSDGR